MLSGVRPVLDGFVNCKFSYIRVFFSIALKLVALTMKPEIAQAAGIVSEISSNP